MRQTAGVALFFICLSIIFIEPVRDSLNNLSRRDEINEERALGTAVPYKQHIKEIQSALLKSGFDPGGADGNMGEETRQALRSFQASRGFKPTGWLDARTLEAIRKEEKLHQELAQMEQNRQIHAQFAPTGRESSQMVNVVAFVIEEKEAEPHAEPKEPLKEEPKEALKEAPKAEPKTGTKGAQKPVYDVKLIQKALKKAGLYKGKVDGKIGKQTQKAIRVFQKKNKLKVDGVVGGKTWTALKKYL